MTDYKFFSFIFIGDTHGFLDDFKKQKEIIEQVKPDFVLSEQLQDKILDSEQKYNNIIRTKFISDMTKFEEVKDLILLCQKLKIKLIGMDLFNFGFDTRMQEIVNGLKQATKEDEKLFESILKKRQDKHKDVISKYQKLSDKPIIIILGSWHLRDDSEIIKKLNNYLVVYPCKDGELILEPTSGKIDYCEKIKK